jgi:hypothetical protein
MKVMSMNAQMILAGEWAISLVVSGLIATHVEALADRGAVSASLGLISGLYLLEVVSRCNCPELDSWGCLSAQRAWG